MLLAAHWNIFMPVVNGSRIYIWGMKLISSKLCITAWVTKSLTQTYFPNNSTSIAFHEWPLQHNKFPLGRFLSWHRRVHEPIHNCNINREDMSAKVTLTAGGWDGGGTGTGQGVGQGNGEGALTPLPPPIPPVNRLTYRCENITFRFLRNAVDKILQLLESMCKYSQRCRKILTLWTRCWFFQLFLQLEWFS